MMRLLRVGQLKSELGAREAKGRQLHAQAPCAKELLPSRTTALEFPLWLSRLKTWHSVYENAGSTPGLTQWVNDPSWLWLWLRPAGAAPIQPSRGNSMCHRGGHKKEKKKVSLASIWILYIKTNIRLKEKLQEKSKSHLTEYMTAF